MGRDWIKNVNNSLFSDIYTKISMKNVTCSTSKAKLVQGKSCVWYSESTEAQHGFA